MAAFLLCGRLRGGKSFFHVCSLGRCSHVFGLLCGHTRPLAIMPSADQVPINSPHSTMLGGNWVVLIAGSTGSALRAVGPPNLHITPVVRRDLVYRRERDGYLVAPAIRAILLASAMVATFVWRRANCCEPEPVLGAMDLGIPDEANARPQSASAIAHLIVC